MTPDGNSIPVARYRVERDDRGEIWLVGEQRRVRLTWSQFSLLARAICQARLAVRAPFEAALDRAPLEERHAA